MIVKDELDLREVPACCVVDDPVVPIRDPAIIHEYLLNRSHLVDQMTHINLLNIL